MKAVRASCQPVSVCSEWVRDDEFIDGVLQWASVLLNYLLNEYIIFGLF